MKIGIIGAGSIGLLFASYLNKDYSVTLYTKTKGQAEELTKNGLILQKGSLQIKSVVKVLPITEWEGTEAITIIAVKQYHLNTIVDQMNNLQMIPKNLLFLQNGMGHLKLLEKVAAENIFVGSVEHGALKMNPFTVSHNGEGVTKLAVFRGESAPLQEFMEMLSFEGFPMVFQSDYYEMLINKLIINAVINPLTALLQVENGELIKNHYYFKVVRNLFVEIAAIVNLKVPEHLYEQLVKICQQTANNQSSMLKDFKANRKAETDAILGFLLEEAEREGKLALQIETLYDLLKGKEMAWGD